MKLHKEYCEIAGCPITDEHLLEHHHIVERTEINTDNNPWNLAVLCCNHHKAIDDGYLEIIGVYPFTNKHGRILIYKIDGIPNVPGIDKPYYNPKPKGFKV